MKKILFIFPLVLLIIGCGDKMSDDEMPDDTEEEIDDSCYPIETKRIEREDTYYTLFLKDKASYEKDDSLGYVLIDTMMNKKDSLLREPFQSGGFELNEGNWDPVLGIITFTSSEMKPPYITVTFQYDILSEKDLSETAGGATLFKYNY